MRFLLFTGIILCSISICSSTTWEVIVGPNGQNVFSPSSLTISVGDSIVFNKTNAGIKRLIQFSLFSFSLQKEAKMISLLPKKEPTTFMPKTTHSNVRKIALSMVLPAAAFVILLLMSGFK